MDWKFFALAADPLEMTLENSIKTFLFAWIIQLKPWRFACYRHRTK